MREVGKNLSFLAGGGEMGERIRAMDADYHRASTAEAVETTLLDYLASRSRSRRGG